MESRGRVIAKQIVALGVGAVIGTLLAMHAEASNLEILALALIMSGIFYFPTFVTIETTSIGAGVGTFFVVIIYMFIMAAGEHNILMILPLIAVPVCVILSIVAAGE